MFFFFFFNDTAPTEIYTLSLHDALPVFVVDGVVRLTQGAPVKASPYVLPAAPADKSKATPFPAAAPTSVHVYFAKGQATLDAEAMRAIRVGSAAYIGIGTKIMITGYADKTGNAAANVELAKKRAQAVRD